jgi:uncharacterized protein YeaO (DUF488 family)
MLVDRLWPRGVNKENAKIDYWMKEIAPSASLRRWFAHKEERWEEFKVRYFEELKEKKEILKQLEGLGKNKMVTLLYAAKGKERNNAQVLLEFITKKK